MDIRIMSFRLPTILALLVFSSAAAAGDLTKIERKVDKEPSYRSRPKYCLLVFGPEAKSRVWLVQDGNTLYVDRNGNGDLTEPGDKVAAEKRLEGEHDDGTYTFAAGELRVGAKRHLNLFVSISDLNRVKHALPEAEALLKRDARARQYDVRLEVEVPGFRGQGAGGRLVQGAGLDSEGLLQFADRPEDAPVIHFGGRWTIALYRQTNLWLERMNDLALVVGTPGLGAGTFAYVGYEGVVPDGLTPHVEIDFPPLQSGGPPVRADFELSERC
jgi:hypothetical protein